MLVILATWEVEIRKVGGQLQQINSSREPVSKIMRAK
jgi:hypothetical protein